MMNGEEATELKTPTTEANGADSESQTQLVQVKKKAKILKSALLQEREAKTKLQEELARMVERCGNLEKTLT